MAWIRMCGGGDSDSAKLYLYKTGDVRTKITGGWSSSGYTYLDNDSTSGAISLSDEYINVTTPGSWYTSGNMGTVNTVDFTGYSTLVAITSAGEKRLDVTSIYGKYYIDIISWRGNDGATYSAKIFLSSTKNYVLSGKVGQLDLGATSCRIYEIYLEK